MLVNGGRDCCWRSSRKGLSVLQEQLPSPEKQQSLQTAAFHPLFSCTILPEWIHMTEHAAGVALLTRSHEKQWSPQTVARFHFEPVPLLPEQIPKGEHKPCSRTTITGPKLKGRVSGHHAQDQGTCTHTAGTGRQRHKPTWYQRNNKEEVGKMKPTKSAVDVQDNFEGPELDYDLEEPLSRARDLEASHRRNCVNQQMQSVLQPDNVRKQRGVAGA
ncbi:hypothetical protein NDU88_004146 [Pleurodeles waltl]|uniref:Uncharacterized protein n=1 Tax=Pleurodeles waltl TaxID=8319 RepID=A0AAV7UEH5_PLEWA|nr:hypothetical protein NDU88_004146 [Pleurodeles waltl]